MLVYYDSSSDPRIPSAAARQGRDEQTKFLIPKSKFNLVPGSILSYNKLLFYFSNQRRWETGSFKYVFKISPFNPNFHLILMIRIRTLPKD